MDNARHIIAVFILISVPIALGLWYLIHPFARYWRRIGPAWTYGILTPPSLLAAWALYRARDVLLGADLGTTPARFVLVVAGAIGGAVIARSRRRQLTQRVLLGVPELSSRDRGHLLTGGIYGRVRNPRYLEFVVFILAYVAFANYVGTWVLYVLVFPVVHGVVLLEERELRERFGSEYEEYCRRVPRYLPRRVPPAASETALQEKASR